MKASKIKKPKKEKRGGNPLKKQHRTSLNNKSQKFQKFHFDIDEQEF
ncbi:MAG: hypothetical protein Kow0079_13330 [Vicingaceae bacterium]